MKMIKISLIVVLSFFFAAGPEALAESCGKISYIEGRVDKKAAGEEQYFPAIVGDELGTGDTIRTKTYSKAELLFDDESIVRLADSSQVNIDTYDIDNAGDRKNAVISLARGKMRAIVSKNKNKTAFSINTPNASGSVKGSDVFVSYQKSATGVLVLDGILRTINTAFPEDVIDVRKGTASYVPYDAPPQAPRPYLPMERELYKTQTGPEIKEIAGISKGNEITLAKVVRLAGPVRIQPGGSNLWHNPVVNEILNIGDKIETGENGRIEIALENGHLLTLKPQSQVLIRILSQDPKTGDYENLFECNKGRVIAKLRKIKEKSSFQIKTPTVTCGVRGTIMYIEVLPNLTRVFFEGGSGFVTSLLSNITKIVQAGQTTSGDSGGNVGDPVETTDEERENFGTGWGNEDGDTYGYSDPGETGEGDSVAGPDFGSSIPGTGGMGEFMPFDGVIPEENNTGSDSGPQGGSQEEEVGTIVADFSGKFAYFGSFMEEPDSPIAGVLFLDKDVDPWIIDPFVIRQLAFGGAFNNPHGRNLFFGEVAGRRDVGGSIYGGMFGVGYGGNKWEALVAGLFIDPSGYAGTIFSDIVGTHDMTQPGNMYGIGNVFYTPITETDILPENLGDLDNLETTSDPGFMSCAINSALGYFNANFQLAQLSIVNELWGVWSAIFEGAYDRPSELSQWSGTFGAYIEERGFFLGAVEAVDNLIEFLHMDILCQYLGLQYSGAYYGTIIGTYHESESYLFQGMGAGGWFYEALKWSAVLEAAYHYFTYGDTEQLGCGSGIVDYCSEHFGFAGSTGSPFLFPGQAVGITLMGEAFPLNCITWWGNITGSYANDGSVLPEGFVGGRTNSIEGFLVSLYIDGAGNAGRLLGTFGGNYDDTLAMWIASGSVTAEKMSSGYYAENYEYDAGFINGYLSGEFDAGGEISQENDISWISQGQLGSYAAWLINPLEEEPEPWGIFNIELGGNFDSEGTSDSWMLHLGGDSWRGLDDDGERWFATVYGTQWSDQRIAGTLEGKYINYRAVGDIQGYLLGSYDTANLGSWEAIALGTFDESPLAYVSEIEGTAFSFCFYEEIPELVREYDPFYSCSIGEFFGSEIYFAMGEGYGGLFFNEESFLGIMQNGFTEGLIGGAVSLWTGNPSAATYIGNSFTNEEMPSFIWISHFYSINPEEESYTTYDHGAYYGYLLANDRSDGADAQAIGLCVFPDEGGVGYVAGSLQGQGHVWLGGSEWDGEMSLLEGELTAYQMDSYDVNNMSPEDLYYESNIDGEDFDSESAVEHRLMMGSGVSIDGIDLTGDDLNLSDLSNGEFDILGGAMFAHRMNFQDADWGVWASGFAGIFAGNDPSSLWERLPFTGVIADIAIVEALGDFIPYAFSGQMNFDQLGMLDMIDAYYMGSINGIEWNPNSRISGDFQGLWFSPHPGWSDTGEALLRWGIFSGDVVGDNSIEWSDEGEAFVAGTWEAIGSGTWVEAEELLNLTDIASELEEVMAQDFISMPISETLNATEVCGHLQSATMDIALFAQESALTGVWAALISGTYQGNPGSHNWGAQFSTDEGTSIDLTGISWHQSEWTAVVTGEIGGNYISGNAAGTYAQGNFEGVGAGVWVDKDAVDNIAGSAEQPN